MDRSMRSESAETMAPPIPALKPMPQGSVGKTPPGK